MQCCTSGLTANMMAKNYTGANTTKNNLQNKLKLCSVKVVCLPKLSTLTLV